jgi:hypothetical protein
VVLPDHHAVDAVVVRDERKRARVVPDLDALLLRDLRERIHQTRAAATASSVSPPQNLNLPPMLNACGPRRGEAHALLAHPHHRGMALLDEDLGQVGSQRYSVTRAMSSKNCSSV